VTRGLPFRTSGEGEHPIICYRPSQIPQGGLGGGENVVAEMVGQPLPQYSVAGPRVGKPGWPLQEIGHDA